ERQLLALGERLQAPMVHTMRGKEYVEGNNPYDIGMTGLIGFSSGYYAMRDCDVLLMLGTDFPYRQFYPDAGQARIVQVDIRPENIGRRAAVHLGVVGEISATLDALLPRLDRKRNSAHLQQAQQHYSRARADLDELRTASRAAASSTPNRSFPVCRPAVRRAPPGPRTRHPAAPPAPPAAPPTGPVTASRRLCDSPPWGRETTQRGESWTAKQTLRLWD